MLTREISSRDEIIPVYAEMLFLFTRFYRDEISSHDELIPVKKTEIKIHSGMKKRKKDVQALHPEMKFINE